MGKFEVWFLDENQSKYKKYVAKSLKSTPYHMLEYLLAEEKAEKYPIKIFSYAEGDKFAVFPGVVRRVNDLPFSKEEDIDIYDMITPHEYSGILTNDNRIVSKLLLNMNEYCAMEKIISVFIRLNPYLAEQIHCFKETGYEVSCVTKQVMVKLQQSEDALLQAYDSSTKRNLKRARAKKLSFEIAEKNEINRDIFIEMYKRSMEFLNAKQFFYFNNRYFDYLFSCDFVVLCFVKNEVGSIIASAVLMTHSQYAYYHLGCFDREYSLLRPMDFLFYSMSTWCKNQGYAILHLGGGSDSLLRFKRKFSKDNVSYYMIRKVAIEDLYDQICKKWSSYYDVQEVGEFFPRYRINEK